MTFDLCPPMDKLPGSELGLFLPVSCSSPTYARQLYLVGTDLVAIQQNLGHDRQETTLDYIGTLDAEQRTPGDAYGTTWLHPYGSNLLNRNLPASFERLAYPKVGYIRSIDSKWTRSHGSKLQHLNLL